MLTKKDFDKFVKQIRKEHPKLRIRVYTKKRFLASGATGEYGWGELCLAVGGAEKFGWEWAIGTLAHEYAHYRREQRHTATYNNRTYRATHRLYSENLPIEVRRKAMYWTVRDEYYTDIEAYEILKRWGVEKYFEKLWWQWAASYNYRIKYYIETGDFIVGGDSAIKTPRRKFKYKEIVAPISAGKMLELKRHIAAGRVKVQGKE